MTVHERSEHQALERILEEIRKGFLQIADECHDAVACAPQKELDQILADLEERRRELSSRYRLIRSRMDVLEARAA